MNAGVGIMGLATVLARKGLRWDSIEGKHEIHRIFERHMYWLIKASIAISKERGLAPWIHKTKWPEGWTPLKTYNRNVDKIADFKNVYDWDALSQELIDNGGIAHSVLSAMMPGESSSKALGSTNSVYPIRSVVITKTDGESNITRWAAVDGDILGDAYQSAWDVGYEDMIQDYAIMQKWTDQGISADMYRRFAKGETTVSEDEVVKTFLLMLFYGMKSRYYTNTQRPKQQALGDAKSLVDKVPGAAEAAAATEAEAAKEAQAVIAMAKEKQSDATAEGMTLGSIEVAAFDRLVSVLELFRRAQALFTDTFLVKFIGVVDRAETMPKEGNTYGDSILLGNDWWVWNTQEWVKVHTMTQAFVDGGAVEYVESEQEDACADGACKL
jgi:hypothetical protein